MSEPSLLDHIFTNFTSNSVSGIIHYPISDHLPIFHNICTPTKSHTLHKITFRSITKTNKQTFSNKINDVEWNDLLTRDLNANFNKFLERIHKLYNECFPLQTKFISEKRLNSPWISQAVINSIRTKNNLYKDFKVGAVSENYYKHYRNTLNNTIKLTKKSYYHNIFCNFKNNTKQIWNIINQLTNNNRKKQWDKQHHIQK